LGWFSDIHASLTVEEISYSIFRTGVQTPPELPRITRLLRPLRGSYAKGMRRGQGDDRCCDTTKNIATKILEADFI
jgi:hypothetical protein